MIRNSQRAFVIVYQQINVKEYSFSFFRRTKEFNFKVMLKVPKFVFRFLGKKILEFCEASKSYTSAIYDKILSTVVKCLCE